MRQVGCLFRWMAILLGVIGLYACSANDVLDEMDDKYLYSMILLDHDEEDPLTIDILQRDCDGDLSTADSESPFTDLFAIITMTVDSMAAGLNLEYYELEYIALPSPDSSGNLVTSPTLLDGQQPLRGTLTWKILPGETQTNTITCMTVDTKNEILSEAGYSWVYFTDPTDPTIQRVDYIYPDPSIYRYTLRVTLHFSEINGSEDHTFVFERTVYFGDYNLC